MAEFGSEPRKEWPACELADNGVLLEGVSGVCEPGETSPWSVYPMGALLLRY